MTADRAIDRLQQIVSPDRDLYEDNVIIVENGEYHVFKSFRIVPADHGFAVWHNTSLVGEFYTARNALSWCIAEKFKNYRLSEDIQKLDADQGRLTEDIAVTQQQITISRNPEYKYLVNMKLKTKKTQLNYINERLLKCVNVAKYFQTKGFNDEIARTRYTTPHTTDVTHHRKPNGQKTRS